MRTKFATKLRIKLCTGFYKKKSVYPKYIWSWTFWRRRIKIL